MKKHIVSTAWSIIALLLALGVAAAHDINGPNDCQRQQEDHGDAPEGVAAYPGGILGRFPTCGPIFLLSTQELDCPAISSPPGPDGSGYVMHLPEGSPYWLGCYIDAVGPMGLDQELEGKVNSSGALTSNCANLSVDCWEPAFGMNFGQDECYADGSDAGVTTPPAFVTCTPISIAYTTFNCDVARIVYLNVCVDFNHDGDWNDVLACPSVGGCAYEWAVKNASVTLPSGCGSLSTPSFLVGPIPGPTWFRISLTNDPVHDDYPWNGSRTAPLGFFVGGETEDYPAIIGSATAAVRRTWGQMKTIYR